MPTRSGRFGRAFVSGDEPYLNIRNSRFALDSDALDSTCACVCCRNYSRGYLHHLFRVDEMLGPILLSIHNLTHYESLMRSMREAIENGTFEALYKLESSRWRGIEP
jgi:queuine tRNA-ribosyltransferase